jgi:predicted dehydrogenase
MRTFLNRRDFLKTASLGLATVPFLAPRCKAAASQRVRLAFIGCGGRARQMIPMFASHKDVEVVALCDVIEPRLEQSMELLGKMDPAHKPQKQIDYRAILDRADVDGVVISTTQHWHGLPHIHSCQAAKHVFVEKPLSHTVVEGRAMVEAARKHRVIAIMGTQQRAGPHYQKAVEAVRGGRLGKVALVECWNYHNTGKRVGRVDDSPVPAGYHWDRWLGPAPCVPFNFGRLNNSWWFDYAGGMLTNWAIHHIDIILWAMDDYSPRLVSCRGGKFVVDDMADTPDTIEASWEFRNWMMQYSYRGFSNFHQVQSRPNHHGICFYGDKATMVIDRHGYQIWNDDNAREVAETATAVPYFDLANPMRSEQDGPWQRLFVDCIKGEKRPPLELEDSHKGTVCCHLANISYLNGRTIRWDGEKEQIIGDAEASGLLTRPRRKGYELPLV